MPINDLSKNIYETIFKASGLGMAQIGLDGELIEVNDKVCEIFQYTKDEILSKSFKDITHPHDFQKDQEFLNLMINKKIDHYTVEKRYYRKDGVVIWVNLTVTLVLDKDENPEFFVYVIDDISKKVFLRDELLEYKKNVEDKENLLATVIDEIPDVLVLKDKNGNFILGNKVVANLYGTTSKEMVGKQDCDFGVPKEMSDFMRENVISIMKKGETEIVYEDSRDAKTGNIRHFKSIKKPFKNTYGEDQILVIAHDVTDLKEAELALINSQKLLNDTLELVGEGIWNWDISSNTVTHNHKWCEMVGVTDDLMQHPLDFFASKLAPEDKEVVFQRIQKALQNDENYYSQHKMVSSDGRVFWVEDRGKIIERDDSGKPIRMIGTIRDITA
ncbi:MAG: PAS domain S-box protein [Campylobacterales bacterium]|nr:PAS domain S-box protein [Campylobacterales bacterium]